VNDWRQERRGGGNPSRSEDVPEKSATTSSQKEHREKERGGGSSSAIQKRGVDDLTLFSSKQREFEGGSLTAIHLTEGLPELNPPHGIVFAWLGGGRYHQEKRPWKDRGGGHQQTPQTPHEKEEGGKNATTSEHAFCHVSRRILRP